jgi:uncharacterized protein
MNKPRALDPRRLDVAGFAAAGAALEGEAELTSLPRLAADLVTPADAAPAPVRWSAQGVQRSPVGRPQEIWIELKAQARVWLACQRCLNPLPTALDVDRRIRFVAGEDEAARLDEELEDDVLALPRSIDLVELVEDELILALPLVPRHAQCPTPASSDAPAAVPARPNPFAVLASIKNGERGKL